MTHRLVYKSDTPYSTCPVVALLIVALNLLPAFFTQYPKKHWNLQ